MPPAALAGGMIGAQVLGGLLTSRGQKKAAEAQRDAMQSTNAAQLQFLREQRAPFDAAARDVSGALRGIIGAPGFAQNVLFQSLYGSEPFRAAEGFITRGLSSPGAFVAPALEGVEAIREGTQEAADIDLARLGESIRSSLGGAGIRFGTDLPVATGRAANEFLARREANLYSQLTPLLASLIDLTGRGLQAGELKNRMALGPLALAADFSKIGPLNAAIGSPGGGGAGVGSIGIGSLLSQAPLFLESYATAKKTAGGL